MKTFLGDTAKLGPLAVEDRGYDLGGDVEDPWRKGVHVHASLQDLAGVGCHNGEGCPVKGTLSPARVKTVTAVWTRLGGHERFSCASARSSSVSSASLLSVFLEAFVLDLSGMASMVSYAMRVPCSLAPFLSWRCSVLASNLCLTRSRSS